jgi:hypothetical protein
MNGNIVMTWQDVERVKAVERRRTLQQAIGRMCALCAEGRQHEFSCEAEPIRALLEPEQPWQPKMTAGTIPGGATRVAV